MPVPTPQSLGPFASNPDETNLDATTTADGFVDCTITIHLNGSVAQVQADWATLLATSLTSPSALMAWMAS